MTALPTASPALTPYSVTEFQFSPNNLSKQDESFQQSESELVVDDSREEPNPSPTPRTGRFLTAFERPDYIQLAIHILLCFIAFPILYFIPSQSTKKGLPMFWTRTIGELDLASP